MTDGTIMAVFIVLATVVAGDGPQTAWIDVDKADGLTVRSVIEADDLAEGTYELTVTRAGQSGRSSTRQAGAFTVAAGQRDTLSTSRFNISAGDRLRAELVVTWSDGGTDRDVYETELP